jgi:small subunit ribosomal protein S27e
MAKTSETKEAKFVEVKCPDCNNKQILFVKCATKVQCQACGSTLATPTGGKAIVKGEIVEVVE